MLKIKKVLFPTDFSECAESAYAYADHLAATYHAELHVLHTIIWPGDAYYPSTGYLMTEVEQHQILERLRIEAEEHLQQFSPVSAREDLQIVQAQVTGVSAAQSILDYIDSHDIDVVVMGTHGRHGLNRMFLGSVAEQVVRRSHCPAITVRHKSESPPSELIEHILVPVDFSEHTTDLLRYARALAIDNDAEIEFLHVVPDIYMPTVYGIEPIHLQFKEIQDRSKLAMEEQAQKIIGQDVRVSYHTVVGDPAQQIVDYVDEHGTDLMLIATHGFTGIKRLFMGSVTERVVRSANCPVLTVKSLGKSLLAPVEAAADAASV